jgi:hypothetical protein
MLPFQTRKRKLEDQNPFTVCPSSKGKFIVCPFVDEETNVSYPFVKGLKGQSHEIF